MIKRICRACEGKGHLILYSWTITQKPVGQVICQKCMGEGRVKDDQS